jgi:hypothetical protein
MNSLNLIHSLIIALAVVVLAAAPAVQADSAKPTLRTANVVAMQPDSDDAAAPLPASVPPSPTPLQGQSGVGSPGRVPGTGLPPAPVPDPQPAPSGGAVYQGPLGSDFQRPPPPPKRYLGDVPAPVPGDSIPTDAVPPPLRDPITNLPFMGTDRYGMSPPSGTLGQTYRRRSQLMEDEKHPRIGAVEVHLSENYDVSAKGLKSKWTGKLWRLESDPLLPGIPHIYDVKAEWGPEGAKNVQTRRIRLIMGRIVDLEF